MVIRSLPTIILLSYFLSSTAMAINLGNSKVMTSLGDPIAIEIEVVRGEGVPIREIDVSIGSKKDFKRLGLAYDKSYKRLKLDLKKSTDDETLTLLITGPKNLKVAHLDLVLNLNYTSLNISKRYSMDFIPAFPTENTESNNIASIISSSPAPTIPTPYVSEISEMTVNLPAKPKTTLALLEENLIFVGKESSSSFEPKNIVNNTISEHQITVQASKPLPVQEFTSVVDLNLPIDLSSRNHYQTQSGDTLLSIALEFLPSKTYDSYQMLIGLHNLNATAFADNNITLLMKNETLLIPTNQDLDDIDPQNAKNVFEGRWSEGIDSFFESY